MAGAPAFLGRDLDLELLDPRSVPLVRLFRHPNGEWDEPPPANRTLRVDPPPGHESKFAVLYTADQLPCVAAECRVLSIDLHDKYSVHKAKASTYEVARYDFDAPALFIPIDGRNMVTLGLTGGARRFSGNLYLPYQEVSLELFQRFGDLVHGLSWNSFHRNQPGRVYAIWHHRKAALRLTRPVAPFVKLDKDAEWAAFLAAWPTIDFIGP